MIYSIVSYPGNQESLLQEPVHYGVKDDTEWARQYPFLHEFSSSCLMARCCKLQDATLQAQNYGLSDKPSQYPLLKTLKTLANPLPADLANSFPFLGILIKEVQRLHDPSCQPGRTALADVIIPGGYQIPKDAVMIVTIHHLHKNPKLWDDPEKFDPNRLEYRKGQEHTEICPCPFFLQQDQGNTSTSISLSRK